MAFTVPNKPDLADALKRQAQIHQTDIDILAEAVKGNGVLRGCELELDGGMAIQTVEGVIGLRNPQNVIFYGLEEVDIDRRNVASAPPVVLRLGVEISEGDATYDRFDLVYADFNGLQIAEGEPAATPIKPDFPRAEGDRALGVVLYEVYVPAGTTELATDMLTDKRVFVRKPRDHWAWVMVSQDVTKFPAWD